LVWDEYQSTGDINFITNYIEQNYKKEFIDFVLMGIKDELENFRIKDFIKGVDEFRPFSQDFSLLLQTAEVDNLKHQRDQSFFAGI